MKVAICCGLSAHHLITGQHSKRNRTALLLLFVLAATSLGLAKPGASLSPTSLTFGNQNVSTTSAGQAVTLTNTGNSSLSISSITTSGDFAQTNNCGTSLAARATCTINVTFTPTATGTRTGTLSVSDNASGSPQKVTLAGTGTAPVVSLSPSSLTFGNQNVGTTSAAQTVTLSNTGTGSLSITSITTSGDFAQTNNCGSSVAAGANCTINLTFSPTTTGTRNGSVSIADNASGSPQTVSLTGTGVVPVASLSPTSLTFGSQNTGTTSAPQVVTLSNTGTSGLSITSITTSGDFAQTNNCGSTVAAGANCTISVTFSPTAGGTRTGTLSVTDNASGSPQAVSLTGTGVAVPNVSLSTNSLTFAGQSTGSTSAAQNVTLTNTGAASLSISSITISGDFAQTNTCGTSVAAGSNCTISVTFTPHRVGTRTGTVNITDNASGSPQGINLTGTGQFFVATQHNDNARTGQDTNEVILTPSNVSASVNPNQFGRLFSQTTDGQAYAQPLYVSNLNIAGGTHNVVFVATENDSVYAFDADSNTGANANPLWRISLLASGEIAVPYTDIDPSGNCNNIVPVIGITSTPVIDLSTNTMYVEAKSENSGTFIHRLHALDITTGAEKFGGPVTIAATASGFTFNSKLQLNRPGLLLSNDNVYIAFASHCDISPYHGWVLAYNASNLSQTDVFMTPVTASFNGSFYGAGIWMSGNGVAADSSGNLYFSTGNGTADGTSSNLGDSIVKLSSNTAVADFYTPADQATLLNGDIDLGSGGVLLLPDQPGSHPHELVQVGKEGKISVVDRDQMTTGNVHYCPNCSVDPIVQEIPNSAAQCSTCPVRGMWSSPTYWNGSVYFWAQGDVLKAFTLSNGMLNTTPAESSTDVYNYPGATPSISANGSSNGIVWSLKTDSNPTVLRAHDPANQLQLLYSSDTNPGRDNAGGNVKFTVPTIANGKVYVGADGKLSLYGQNPPDFTISVSPSSQSFPSGGGTQNYVVSISPVNGFNANVTITLTNLPAGTTYVCTPNPITGGSGSSTCAVTTSGSTPIGTFTFTITGNGGGITHSTTAQIVQHGVMIVRPTTFTNGACANCIDYNNPANAFDGNLSTAATGPAGALDTTNLLWTTDGFSGFGSVTGTPTAINLKVSSAYNIGPNDFVYITYSTSTTSGTIYVFSSAASRGQQTDVVSLPTNTDLTSVSVAGLVGNHSTASQQIYEIWIEVTE